MNQMVTTCPNCRQQLAVTAGDLRVGQGYVRCGRCDKVFNALITLSEDSPAPTEPESVAHGTRSVPALEDPLPPLPGEPIPFGSMEEEVEVVQTHSTGEFRSIVLEGEDAPEPESAMESAASPEPVSASEVDREELARDIIRQATSQPIDILLDEEKPPAASTVTQSTAPESYAAFDVEDALGQPRRAHPLWVAAAVLLALAFVGQLVHHNRRELVAAVPWLAGPINGLYGMFGNRVEPPWDLRYYEITQLAEPAARSGTLLLQASLAVSKNAPWGHPPPVIRTVLSDRWGNVLATEDLAPSQWALGEAPARLAPGQRLDARLALRRPDRALSYTLSACLPDTAGALRCRDDP